MDEILVTAPVILGELMREFVRRGDEEYQKDPQSQAPACFFLAIRSTSLLCGIGKLLKPQTRDATARESLFFRQASLFQTTRS
jgi:hypothetical protein